MDTYIAIALGIIVAVAIFIGLIVSDSSVLKVQNDVDSNVVEELNDKF